MENNQNLDGLDGLPLESWMNPMHLSSVHPTLPNQIYHQPMGAQPLHDYVPHRALQTFSTEPVLHTGQSSHLISPSARLHQLEHLPASHERSAWSHLLSLDPSTVPVGSHIPKTQDSLRHCLSQDLPHSSNTRQEPLLLLKGSTSQLVTSFDNRSLPSMHFSLATCHTAAIPLDNCSRTSVANSSQSETSQQFSQLMNLSSKIISTSKPSAPKTLAISSDVPTLESSGSYSPVSPVAPDADLPAVLSSSSTSGRVAELLLREPHEMSATAFPLFSSTDHADIFNYLEDKADPFLSDLSTQDYTEPSEAVVSDFLHDQSNVPLDMRTACTSKEDSGNGLKELSQIDTAVASAPEFMTNDKSSLVQTLLSKSQANLPRESVSEASATMTLSERKQSQLTLPVTFIEKVTKPIKSTPKKSNFYGRDASLFSFVSSSSNDTQIDIAENVNFLNSASEVSTDAVAIKEHSKPDKPEEPNAPVSAIVKTVTVNTNINCTKSEELPAEPILNTSSVSSASLPVLCISSFGTLDHDSFDMSEATDSSFGKDVKTENMKQCDQVNGNSLVTVESCAEKEPSGDNVDNMSQNLDTSCRVNEDLPVPHIISRIKVPKRKKRKATGFQSKHRKKPARKQIDVFNDNVVADSNDHNTDMDVQDAEVADPPYYENTLFQGAAVPVKRRTRKPSKASSLDTTPRRSSNRKSKDNAMRLIELQADSNYGGIAQPEEVVEKKSTRKRKNIIPNPALTADDGFNEFSDGDSTDEDKSDENDFDYVIDEDEINALKHEEIIDHQPQIDKKSKERKHGGLKISIKLSGNSSAEIVSGIEDFRSKKKKKSMKKKTVKIKGKNRLKVNKQEVENNTEKEIQNLGGESENAQEPGHQMVSEKYEETGGSLDTKDRHVSLMEKYFSSANSAAVARQNLKNAVPGKLSASKSKNADKNDGKKSKFGKNVALKLGTVGAKKKGNEKVSVKLISESAAKRDKVSKVISKENAETEIAKFVCGYCPQRYHNKQELLVHIQAHMVEMEEKTNDEVASGGDESRKAQAITVNPTVSRDPRSNCLNTAASGESALSRNTSESGKLKLAGDLPKDSSIKHAQDLKQKFKCGECGQIFDSKHGLLDHVRDHTTEKPFECDICHKCFTERTTLSVHRKTHDKDKLLRCHMCSKAFVHKIDFNLHMKSHPRSSTKSSGEHILANKKSMKKNIGDKHDEKDPFSSKKPKSFASALTGEPDVPEKTGDSLPVLVLKRGDGPSTEVHNSNSSGFTTGLSEPKVILKPITPSSYKTNVVKAGNHFKLSVESSVESKGDKNKVEIKNSGASDSASVLKTETASSDVCTCKECPDCVTRFLQSFD